MTGEKGITRREALIAGVSIAAGAGLTVRVSKLIGQPTSGLLSNGMKIPDSRIVDITSLNPPRRGTVYVVMSDHSEFIIVDKGEARPYSLHGREYLRNLGHKEELRTPWERVLDEDVLDREKNYNMEYEYEGEVFPVWESAGFRRSKAYRDMQQTLQQKLKENK